KQVSGSEERWQQEKVERACGDGRLSRPSRAQLGSCRRSLQFWVRDDEAQRGEEPGERSGRQEKPLHVPNPVQLRRDLCRSRGLRPPWNAPPQLHSLSQLR